MLGISLLQEIVTIIVVGAPFFAIYMHMVAPYYRDRDDRN